MITTLTSYNERHVFLTLIEPTVIPLRRLDDILFVIKYLIWT